MATLARTPIDTDGVQPSGALVAAAGGGDKAKPGEGVFLVVRNTNGATRDVTINDPTSKNPGAAVAFNPDVTVTVPATTGEVWIPLTERFADPADGGLASWTYTAVTGVTVGVFQV